MFLWKRERWFYSAAVCKNCGAFLSDKIWLFSHGLGKDAFQGQPPCTCEATAHHIHAVFRTGTGNSHKKTLHRQGGSSIGLPPIRKENLIYRLCAGNDERKKAHIRWGTIAVVLRMSAILMCQYTLLIGVYNILPSNLDREKSARCRNGGYLPSASSLL